MIDLTGKVAVVTGASRGLGHDVAARLAGCGAEVAAVSRSSERFRADVGRPEEVERLKAQVERELGAPAILVNAAGMFGPIQLIKDSDPARWVETIMVDLVAAYLTTRAFVNGMIDAGWGRIVNFTSAASLHPPGPLNSAYGTSKAGLNQLTRHLAAELEGTGVTANVIHPGDVKTAMWATIRDDLAGLGTEADGFRQWVDWVEQTGGDPPEKAVDLVLRILQSELNGEFLWVDDPLQPPIPSWGEGAEVQPWLE
jgi:NAD(P)-dependent dehydrogenase (short-subunit alcohol dehydrogenase family)